jgi:hypothetical protein
MSEMGGIIEFALVAMFALGWAILEWQGRRLDRKRAEREARNTEVSGASTEASGTAASPARSGGENGSATGSHA